MIWNGSPPLLKVSLNPSVVIMTRLRIVEIKYKQA